MPFVITNGFCDTDMGQGGSRSQCTCFPLKVEEVGRRHLGTLCGRQNIILGNRELTQELRTNVPSKIKALNHHLVFYPVLASLTALPGKQCSSILSGSG